MTGGSPSTSYFVPRRIELIAAGDARMRDIGQMGGPALPGCTFTMRMRKPATTLCEFPQLPSQGESRDMCFATHPPARTSR